MTLQSFLAEAYTLIFKPVIFLLFGVAFILFVWGIVVSIRDSEEDKGRETGKRNMIWGIVGMVIMVSVFGIINIITGTIGAEDITPPGEDIFPSVR